MTQQFILWANKQELQNLPEDSQYLFCNYEWKHHPAWQNMMELVFSEYEEAAAVYHELWHVRFDIPSLKRNWA